MTRKVSSEDFRTNYTMSSTRPDLKFADNSDERQYYRKYANLPPKNAGTFRVIDHNNSDYFTVLDEDADLIADNIYKTQLVIKEGQGGKVRYVTIAPQVFLNNVLKFIILDKHMKLEVYNNKSFELLVAASPGLLEPLSNYYGVNLEGMILDCSNPIIAALKVTSGNPKKVGVSCVDLSNSTIQVAEFEDNDLFSNLESLLIQLGVKEVLVPSNYSQDDDEHIKLFQVLNKVNNIVISPAKSSTFKNADIEQDLGKILVLKNDQEELNVGLVLASKNINSVDFNLSLSCTNALIVYLQLLNESDNSFTIDQYNLSAYMKLDLSTMKALNIFPNTTIAQPLANAQNSTVTSLFGLLNKCKTAAGSRLLSQWLKQPLTNVSLIRERQELVEMLMNDTNLRVYLSKDFLPKIPDIKKLMKKISTGLKKTSSNENKKLEDVVRLYQLVVILPNLIEMLKTVCEENEQIAPYVTKYWLDPITLKHESLLTFQELVDTTIDLTPLETVSDLNTDFNVKPEFDEGLVGIHDQLQSTKRSIKDLHEEVSEDLNIEIEKKLKLEQHIQHGWCFRVTRNDSVVLRNTDKKYTQLQTVKAGVFFTCKKLQGLAELYNKLNHEFNTKQREVIREILDITMTYQQILLKLSLDLAHLDVLTSFANVAVMAPTTFARPVLHQLAASTDSPEFKEREIKLGQSRHPLLEIQDDVTFIPNDVKLSNAEKSFAIITGPNMGGKSTFIRQVGVIALMSQIGSFVPAEEDNARPEVPVFDAILSRVGAGDSQLKGLSTFMIEMLETSSILATATHNSLVIIDELGRGTSTYDGFGLAWSILEHLIAEIKCFALFATHFHELTKLATIYSSVDNLHVVAHVETENEDDITLMYKVEPGISDKSFGIHVAELVKFPQKIISMAKRKASELQEEEEQDCKKSKLSQEEIATGTNLLKDVLKEWRAQCYDEVTQKCNTTSEEAVSKLKELAKIHSLENDNFVKEIMETL